MSAGVLRTAASGRDGDGPVIPISAARRRKRPQAIYGVGLWVFMGVATVLFSLFIMSSLVLTIFGVAFRGPGYSWTWPWDGIFFSL